MSLDKWRTVTRLFVLFMIVAPFTYTALVTKFVGSQASISYVLRDDGYDYPITAALLGGLFIGLLTHWYWPVSSL